MSLDNSAVVPALPTGGYQIEQSLRFNDNDTAYLSRTPSSSSNRRTFTISFWIKPTKISGENKIIGAAPGQDPTYIMFSDNTTSALTIAKWTGSSHSFRLTTNALYRDVSSWYHIVIAFDTTQATASNRVKLYVNGEQVTSFGSSSYPAQNYQTDFNTGSFPHRIGLTSSDTNGSLDGYLAEFNFVDGQQLDPSNFGETDEDYGHWKPIRYTGSYGTNGFYLDFDGTYYNDKSGNGNNFTANNLATTDVVLDSPTNNFCTMNSTEPDSCVYSQGNLQVSHGFDEETRGTMLIPTTGKWYWEVRINNRVTNTAIGIATPEYKLNTNAFVNAGHILWKGENGYVYDSGTINYGTTYDNPDILGVALNMDSGTLTFYKNGTSAGAVSLNVSISDNQWLPHGVNYSGGSWVGVYNFGQDSSFAGNETAQGNTDGNNIGDFYYTPPNGYVALCTANLSDPAVIPSENFNAVLYTGNGSSTNSITGVGFQPDFVWIKALLNAQHCLSDVVRGVGNILYSNDTRGEIADASNGHQESFDSDGFTVGDNSGTGSSNGSGDEYISWNWKANNTSGSSNTNGTITSTVSANQDAGFSIVSYTGTGSTATIGHGLSSAPEIIFHKKRSASQQWTTYNATIGANKYLELNEAGAAGTASTPFNNTEPTSSVWTVGTAGGTNTSGATYIAYAFHSVDGYSKVGSYTGNTSTDGTFVYTGFRPAFVIIKRTDSAKNWFVSDIERSPDYNPMDGEILRVNTSDAEANNTGNNHDFLSNGFKFRTSDDGYNSGSYIYIAFAEQPFKYTNAR